jgi:hypothetical protein
MITQEQQLQGAELIQTLAQKAWENSAFKNQLVNDPIPTIEYATGIEISTDKKVVVEDQTDESIIYLNIPTEPNFEELELTEDQLEMVSGGITPTFIALGYGFMAGVALMGGAAAVKAVSN